MTACKKKRDSIIIASGNDAQWRAVAYQRKSSAPFHYIYFVVSSFYELPIAGVNEAEKTRMVALLIDPVYMSRKIR